jgi:hypothetical protein
LSSSNQLSYRETVVELQPTELQRDSCRALTNWATERQLSSSNQLSYRETVVEL